MDQSLADLAYFIETKKKEEGLDDSAVIVFGGSYAGNMAAWSRLKYPHLIQVFLSFLFTLLLLQNVASTRVSKKVYRNRQNTVSN